MGLDRQVPSLLRKTLASLAVLGCAAALPLFAGFGAFSGAADPFPRSVVEEPAAQD